MSNITVLTIADRIACFHSLKPFLFNNTKHRFYFTTDPDYCLNTDKNRILIMVRRFIKPDFTDLSLMDKLRAKYDRIAFFHDDAGAAIPRLEVLPFVDLFYSKALFLDRSLYGKELYGKELYSDYYHKKYGVTDPSPRHYVTETRPDQLAKLRLSWNIGIGDYPRNVLRQRAGILAARLFGLKAAKPFYLRRTLPEPPFLKNKGTCQVHCRIGMISRPSINYQRELILKKAETDPVFLTGMTAQKQYNREIANSKITVSPFGWGELCLRDFETIRSGALLLKPDMSHLETWPRVFIPEETYVPFDWDAENLQKTAYRYLEDDVERNRIVKNAFEAYVTQLGALPERFANIIEEIIS
ncbi:glycosyltransferase family 1 protein [Brucepastera parasyntrophica]|uniref:glycosyltransferase n=1 Tax=Brucepastera parasyntrophica TaxID=2880008 RepID=UPI00210C7346|nr:glycosyltransferase [Brucepastera parasyntrophica]ULQ60052.1 glycosyltransferase family 1 protein [Brucepastera parasyntrophica]